MTSSTNRDTRILGSLRRLDDTTGAVTVEDLYDTAMGDLWSAVTEPDRLARWVATVEGDLLVGGTVRTKFTSGYEGVGRIDVCDAPRRLVVTFQPGSPDETVVEANLAPVGDRTRLIIEERGLPIEEVADHGAGWQAHIEDLNAHLVGREPITWHDRWTELRPAYAGIAEEMLDLNP
jgi:uncharacterized protein YndB with AHSA1/START domain